MIRVSHLFFDYPGLRALDNVGFELPPQSITALVGPNGAGKTTLLRSIAALDEPTCGEIWINGQNVWDQPRQAHLQMGYLPDHFGLYPELTAQQCLTYAAWTHGLRGSAADDAVEWAIQQVQLEPQLNKLAAALSRGQRQRLALAQAIVHRPRVLLMDEPASGLDPQARTALAYLMKQLAAQGMTLIISSHILAELETYCTAMLVLEKGQILAHETIQKSSLAFSLQELECAPAKMLRITLASVQQTQLPEALIWLQQQGFNVEKTDSCSLIIQTAFQNEHQQAQLLRDMLQHWDIIECAPHRTSLQDIYLQKVAQHQSGQLTGVRP